jgi:anti-sigma B factor antagonist
MDHFQIQSTEGSSGVCILKVVGPLTLSNVFVFQNTARNVTDRAIIVDLSDVPFVDSVGLGSILGVFASCQRTQRGFALAGAAQRVRTLLQVAKADRILLVADTVEIAETQLSARAQQA